MAWTPVPLIAGVTILGYYANFAVTPPYPPSTPTLATYGVDWDFDAITGKIRILRSFGGGGWMLFVFSDGGGTIAGAAEYPAINGRLTADITACSSGVFHYDMSSKCSATINDNVTSNPQTQTGIIYTGTNLMIAAGSDGSFSGSNPQHMTLLFELDVTFAPSLFWTDLEGVTENIDNDTLTKDFERYIDPGQEGQPFMAPYHHCVPRPPPPPPGGGTPPGGGGSSPPGGGGGDPIISCAIMPLTLPGDPIRRCVRVCVITDESGSTVTTEPWPCP